MGPKCPILCNSEATVNTHEVVENAFHSSCEDASVIVR